MGARSGNSTTVVKNLPSFAESYVQNYLSRASNLSAEAFPEYTETTYAAQNTDEADGITALASRGRNGNQTISKGITLIEDVLDGDYLDGSKADFQTVLGRVTDKPKSSFNDNVKPLLGATLLLMGDLSGGNLAQTLCADTPGRTIDRVSAEIYGRNYDAERGIQGRVLTHGTLYASQSARDAELLRQAGLHMRIYTQGSYEDAYKNWVETEVAKVKRLDILGNAIRTLVGTQEAHTQPYYRTNPLVGMVGGALSGAISGATIPVIGPAVGAIIGAGLGFLSSN